MVYKGRWPPSSAKGHYGEAVVWCPHLTVVTWVAANAAGLGTVATVRTSGPPNSLTTTEEYMRAQVADASTVAHETEAARRIGRARSSSVGTCTKPIHAFTTTVECAGRLPSAHG